MKVNFDIVSVIDNKSDVIALLSDCRQLSVLIQLTIFYADCRFVLVLMAKPFAGLSRILKIVSG